MRKASTALAAALIAVGAGAAAQPASLDPGRFQVRNLGDLVELCRVGPGHPQELEAVGYCHGYGRGALDNHRAVVPAHAPPPN